MRSIIKASVLALGLATVGIASADVCGTALDGTWSGIGPGRITLKIASQGDQHVVQSVSLNDSARIREDNIQGKCINLGGGKVEEQFTTGYVSKNTTVDIIGDAPNKGKAHVKADLFTWYGFDADVTRQS